MTQKNEHIKKLAAARERMIQDRRALAPLANEYKGGRTERMPDSFIVAQNTIEAIDRAIAHETLIATERPGTDYHYIRNSPGKARRQRSR